jgi:hypothetical protein
MQSQVFRGTRNKWHKAFFFSEGHLLQRGKRIFASLTLQRRGRWCVRHNFSYHCLSVTNQASKHVPSLFSLITHNSTLGDVTVEYRAGSHIRQLDCGFVFFL